MNILIIEDEVIAAERMEALVRKTAPGARVLGVCDSIEGSVQFLRTHGMPDLLLMDIELVDGQSFEIFREVAVTCPVIFTTAYDEYALQAFKVHSVDYLLKPIQEEALQQSIAKLGQLKESFADKKAWNIDDLLTALRRTTVPVTPTYRERFLVRRGQQLLSVPVEEILYFYSEAHITFLKTAGGAAYPLEGSLDEVEEQVDPSRFFRASRKHLV
ncbi:MAG TPA: LytTR family DNA-binding domain-containing protein, partial [Chitinophagaceae bacterium]|nr:LytTR family DNA-binding domain-containing protein [Chitinophagaceae bacterium]